MSLETGWTIDYIRSMDAVDYDRFLAILAARAEIDRVFAARNRPK